MSLKSKLRKFGLRFGAKSSAVSPIQAWMRGEDWNPGRGSGVLASHYQQSVWIYTVIAALAQTVSTMPFRISRGDRSGENIIKSGPAVDLFNHPHPHLNRFRFWEFIVTWYCLRGEAFIVALDKSGHVLPLGPNRRPPSRLLVLNPDQLRHVVEGFELVGWNYTASPPSTHLAPIHLLPEE